jgi:4-diphosphocytidyl-2-C-methyl-D-erythritol kinase
VHATGRGEKLEPLADFAGVGVVLAHPPLTVSTAWVYGNYQVGAATFHPDIGVMRKALEKNDCPAVAQNLYNALEAVTIPAYPQIGDIKTALSQAGANGVLMSGSGPTVFALTPNLTEAGKLATRLSIGPEVDILITETVAREEQMNVPSIITG